jgi:alcohol dehydrogenase class IV
MRLVDPDWTHSVPLDVTLDSGLDALAHALEALWNRQAQPLTDALALAAALGAWLDRLGVSFALALDERAATDPGQRLDALAHALEALCAACPGAGCGARRCDRLGVSFACMSAGRARRCFIAAPQLACAGTG